LGRPFPLPTGPGAFGAMKKLSDGKYYLTAYLGPADVNCVHGFVDGLRGIVVKELGLIDSK